MYASVDGCVFLLPKTLLQQQRWLGKKKCTNHSLLFNLSVCWNMSIYSVITRVLMVRAHRWDLNRTRWDLCLPVNVYQFKHLRARWCLLACTVICACTHQKRAYPRLRTQANIKLSLKYCLNGKNLLKNSQNAQLGKYPITDSLLNVQYQCILLKWQHFLNIQQTTTTKKSLTLLIKSLL